MLSAEEFRAEVDEAIAEQPADVRRALGQVSLELVDLPALDDLVAVEPPFAPTIMGLYRGLPLGVEEGTTRRHRRASAARSRRRTAPGRATPLHAAAARGRSDPGRAPSSSTARTSPARSGRARSWTARSGAR